MTVSKLSGAADVSPVRLSGAVPKAACARHEKQWGLSLSCVLHAGAEGDAGRASIHPRVWRHSSRSQACESDDCNTCLLHIVAAACYRIGHALYLTAGQAKLQALRLQVAHQHPALWHTICLC